MTLEAQKKWCETMALEGVKTLSEVVELLSPSGIVVTVEQLAAVTDLKQFEECLASGNFPPAGVNIPETVTPVTPQPEPAKVEPVKVDKPVKQVKPVSGDPVTGFIEYLQQQAAGTIDEDKVREIVRQETAKNVKEIKVIRLDGTTFSQPYTHKKFHEVLELSQLGNVYLYGPAGTGKSYLAEQIATSLNVPFYCEGVGPQSSQMAFKGYMDANGKYVRTQFRDAWENGGVFCLDEVDAGNPAILLSLNMARSRRFFAFADGVIKCHPDFKLIATANTFGSGADRMYIGRNQLDAAFLDGFFNVHIDYDEQLEIAMYGRAAELVHPYRNKLKKERVVISVRSIERVQKLLAIGKTEKEALSLGLFANIPDNLKNLL